MTKRETPADFAGTWRITWMETWADDVLDLAGPSQIVFEKECLGKLRFCSVEGWTDCDFSDRAGRPFVEFSWEGKDDSDARCGRGWAVIDEKGDLHGRVFIHCGDASGFRAVRDAEPRPRPARKKKGTSQLH